MEAVAPGAPPVFCQQIDLINSKPIERQGITDKVQIERGGFTDSPNPRQRSIRRTTIMGEEIAYDLVNEWTKLVHGSQEDPPTYPGVWVVRDRLPAEDEEGKPAVDAEGRQSWREATKEEKMAMWNEDLQRCRLADSNYARFIFDDWNAKIERHPDFVKTLPKQVRLAAAAFGWTAEWLRDGSVIETKTCQFCTKKIRASTIVCPHCQQIIDYDAFYREQAKRQDAAKKYGVDISQLVVAGVTQAPQPPKEQPQSAVR